MLQVQSLLEAVEQALATAEDDRRDRDRQFVSMSGAKSLTDRIRTASDGYVPATRRLAGRAIRLVQAVHERAWTDLSADSSERAQSLR